MEFKRGDEVIIKIKEDFGYTDIKYKYVKLMIVGSSFNMNYDVIEYMCYIPRYEHVKESFKLDDRKASKFGVQKKFVNEQAYVITETTPVEKYIPAIQCAICDHCNEPITYAQADELGRYTCRACRENPYR